MSRMTAQEIPDIHLYKPVLYQFNFAPWMSEEFGATYTRIAPYTLVSADRCLVLQTLLKQALQLGGEVWECGVYRGGTAMLMAEQMTEQVGPSGKFLRLFDTYAGMPATDRAKDWCLPGDFADTSLEAVMARIPGDSVRFYKGLIPHTFAGLESSRIAFAHVDLDIYSAMLAACEFIYPRLCLGGFIVFDDYGTPSCPGARAAIDEYFQGRRAMPLVLPTGQAIVFKSLEEGARESSEWVEQL